MKIFLNVKIVLLLLVGLLTSFGCGVEKVDLSEFDDLQESFPATTRAENVTLAGVLVDPILKEPIAGATIQIGAVSVQTDENGAYAITIEESVLGAAVSITKEGLVDLSFPVDFSDLEDNATIDLAIEIPEAQDPIQFVPGEAVTQTFFYLGVAYEVEIPADAFDEPMEIAIGPSGSVVGPGVSGAFARVGLHIETPLEDAEFNNAIGLNYDPIQAALSGGIGGLHPQSFLPIATPEARLAAQNLLAALAAAAAVTTNGGTQVEATTVFIEESYPNSEEISVAENGDLEIVNTVEGTLIPGIGLITENGTLEQLDDSGVPIEGESIDLIDEETGGTNNIPHQGVGDGGG